jgi:hypothetical protein
MATWKQEHIMLTKVGERALASAEAGAGKITITRIVGSSYNPSDLYNVSNTTGISSNMVFNVVDKKPVDSTSGTTIVIQATNNNVTAKFRMNTLVVFATQSSISSGEFPYMIAKTLNADEVDLPTITPVTLNFSLTILNTRGGLLNLTISNTGFVPIPTYLIDMQDYQNNVVAFGVTTGSAVTQRITSQFLNDHPITLKDGVSVKVKLGYNLKSNSTLNVGGTGDKPILDVTGNTIPNDTFTQGSMLNLMYDATRSAWIVTGGEVLTASNGVKKVGKDMQLVDSGVLTKHIKDLNVTTPKLADKSVTLGKLHDDLTRSLDDKYVNVTGDTMTGQLTIYGSNISFQEVSQDRPNAKIRISSNGNFDIGVNEDSALDNVTSQIMLHSKNKPKWYTPSMGGKTLATNEELDNEVAKKVNKTGDKMTGDITFSNSSGIVLMDVANQVKTKIRMSPHNVLDIGVIEKGSDWGSTNKINLISTEKPVWSNKNASNKKLATEEDIANEVKKYLPLKGGTMTGSINFINENFKGQIALKPNGNLDFGSLDTKCSVLNSKERPLWYTNDTRGGMLALTRDIVPSPEHCVNLYDARDDGFTTGRDRDSFNLKHPYTDYDFLIITLSGDSGNYLGVSQITVSWLEKIRKMSIGTGLEVINIATVTDNYWGISNKSTPTRFITYGYENSHIWEVWGYKIQR